MNEVKEINEIEILNQKCKKMLNEDGIRFIGIINNVGRQIAGGYKTGITPLVDDDEHDFYLIMEDDFTLCSGFKEKIDILKSEMKNKEILFLGYHMFEKEREKVKEIYDYSSNNIQVSKLNSTYFVL